MQRPPYMDGRPVRKPKACKKCGRTSQQGVQFKPHNKAKDGLHPWCLECLRGTGANAHRLHTRVQRKSYQLNALVEHVRKLVEFMDKDDVHGWLEEVKHLKEVVHQLDEDRGKDKPYFLARAIGKGRL